MTRAAVVLILVALAFLAGAAVRACVQIQTEHARPVTPEDFRR